MSDAYLTAVEAAEALGVTVDTLYAYVSRKLLRSYRAGDGSASRYRLEDIHSLRGGAPRTRSGWDDAARLVTQTKITLTSPRAAHAYRGQDAIELAKTATLEAVAATLWETTADVAFPDRAPPPVGELAQVWPIYEGYPSVDRALAAFPVIERANPRAYDLSPDGYRRTGGEALRWFAALVIGAKEPSPEPLHQLLVRHAPDRNALLSPVRQLLVLSADHGLDPTTYAVRAAANTGITPYRAILVGLTTSIGRRLSSGRPMALARFLDEIMSSATPRDVVMRQLREGVAVPGFGAAIYDGEDPRSTALLEALTSSLDGDLALGRLKAAIDLMREARGAHPDFALLTHFVSRKLGLGPGNEIGVRLGRIAGWIAHAMEQYQENDLVRPRTVYSGILPPRSTEGVTARAKPRSRRRKRSAAGKGDTAAQDG